MALEDLRIALSYIADHHFYENYGAAWSCGLNANGQCGLGNTTQYTTPQQLPGYTWKKFATGYDVSFAIKTDGTLWSCGNGNNNQLGYLLTGNQTTFAQIGSDTDWLEVRASASGGYALKTSGQLYTWGGNAGGELGLGNTTPVHQTPQATGFYAVQISAGQQWAAAVTSDSKLYTWGANSNGTLGQGNYTDLTVPTQVGAGTNWAQVACGQLHGAAVKTDGTLWTWGLNGHGQLGHGDITERTSPTQVGAGTTWVEVMCAYRTTYARKSDGTVWSFGRNTDYEAVQGDLLEYTSPTQVGVASDWVQIWADSSDLYARTAAGIYVGGSNWNGSLGLGNATTKPNLVAQNVTFDTPSAPTNITDTAAVSGDTWVNDYISNQAILDTAASSDTLAGSTFTMYLEAIGLSDSLAAGANTTATYADTAAMRDVIQQAINQIVADSADGADSLNLGAALTLVDIANAVETQAPTYNSVLLVAELIATLEAYNGADGYDITESGALSDVYVARVEALVSMLEAVQAVDTNTALVRVMQSVTDSADGAETVSSAGSLLNALLNDGVIATIRLNIGGELFTGWVLNTDTLAPSEYQFADLQFNSACKHGGTYLMAADDGIYQFTEDTGVETVMTYIKTGKTDFGSDLRKSVTDSYLVYSASGQMTLKVTTSLNGAIQTNDYALVPFVSDDTTAPQRAPVGKGIKSRYWQFELIGANAGCTFDEIGMLPVVLSRRI